MKLQGVASLADIAYNTLVDWVSRVLPDPAAWFIGRVK
jgi:hypothetical protein